MKKHFFIILMVFSTSLLLNAQTKADRMAIKQTCLDYIEGWATGNEERVARAMSPELEKRSIDANGGSFTVGLSYSGLLSRTRQNKNGVQAKDFEPDKELVVEVEIYDITGDYATAKITNTKYGFFDYCHLAKFNGEWKIFNVLWGWIPEE
ncbi:nuclear transport factor 2 family protein [Bacteroidota bacterium]